MATSQRTDKLVIKFNAQEGGTFGRESWFGLGPFKAKVGDDQSLTVQFPGQEPEIVVQKTFDDGQPYWIANYAGGKVSLRPKNHPQYGKYIRAQLLDGVVLDDTVYKKATKPRDGATKGKATAPKKVAAAPIWG